MKPTQNTVLVALMNNKEDFAIAQNQQWYRIPVKPAPPIVKENKVKIIAFYHTKVFEKEKFSVRWFAEVKNIERVFRKDLFPNEPINPKSGKEYYKITFSPLKELLHPIYSHMPRRILFIPTTEEKLFSARELNYLFNISPIEEKMWLSLLKERIPAERQFYVETLSSPFILDFAIFCKGRNINLECDGDTFHLAEDMVKSDKRRNNFLEKEGWSVLRFHTSNIINEMDDTIATVKEAINKYGGIADDKESGGFRYLGLKGDNQTKLFK